MIQITATEEKGTSEWEAIERRDVGRPALYGVFGSTLFPPDRWRSAPIGDSRGNPTMSTVTVDRLSLSPGTSQLFEREERTLASVMEELVRLRFSILLTARWEAAETDDPERRGELRAELADLRKFYLDEIDEIAMKFGVQQAMDAKDEVEHNVVLPRHSDLLSEPVDDGHYF